MAIDYRPQVSPIFRICPVHLLLLIAIHNFLNNDRLLANFGGLVIHPETMGTDTDIWELPVKHDSSFCEAETNPGKHSLLFVEIVDHLLSHFVPLFSRICGKF